MATRHWSGAIADALADVLCQHEFSRAVISAEIRDGFWWHSPEVPHPLLADGDAWWRHLGRVRPCYTDPAALSGHQSRCS